MHKPFSYTNLCVEEIKILPEMSDDLQLTAVWKANEHLI